MLNPDKLALIDYAFGGYQVSTFADLGGNWGVDGGYTFYTLTKYRVERAYLVDFHFGEAVNSKRVPHPQLQFVQGDFGKRSIAERIDRVDAVLLFDTLLHQVKPDWDKVIELYSERANHLLVFNQQWIAGERTIRLFDLGKEEYFKNVPDVSGDEFYQVVFDRMYEEYSPEKGRYRDLKYFWQWGITDRDLIAKADEVGFEMVYYRDHGRFGALENFENHAFLFSKRK